MADKLPVAGVRATIEDIQQFKRDADTYNKSLDKMRDTTEKTAEAQGELDKGLGEMPKSFQKLQGKAKGLATEAAGLEKRVAALGSEMVAGGAGAEGLAAGLGSIVATGAAAVGVIVAVAAAAKAMVDSYRDMEPLLEAQEAYLALGGTASDLYGGIVDDVHEASRKTVSEYKIITGQNRDLAAGYKQLVKIQPQLMEIAASSAAAFGGTIESQFNKINAAVRTGNQSALESAGIYIDLDAAYEAAVSGSDRFVDQLSEEEKQLIAIQVVLENYDDIIASMGGAAGDALGPIQELTTALGGLAKSILALGGQMLVFGLETLMGDADIAGWAEDATDKIEMSIMRNRLFKEVQKLGPSEEATAFSLRSQRKSGQISMEEEIEALNKMMGRGVLGLTPETMAEAAANAAAETLSGISDSLRTTLTKQAQQKMLALSPFLSYEEQKASLDRMLDDIDIYLEKYSDVTDFGARREMNLMTSEWDEYTSAVQGANKALSATAQKQAAVNALYGAGAVGQWAQDFAAQHGGQSPMQKYARHEDPLQAALIDKAWGDKFAAREDHAPTDADWQAHWYEQWEPLELYPGGPIAKATGGLADMIDKLIADNSLGGLDDAFHETWMQAKGLAPKLKEVKDEAETIAKFSSETYVPALETQTTAIGLSTTAVNDFTAALKEWSGGDGEEGGGGGGGGGGFGGPEDEENAKRTGWSLPPPAGGSYGPNPSSQRAYQDYMPPGLQGGGLAPYGGLFMLHPNELVVPLNRVADSMSMMNMRTDGGGGGGGLVIQNLNVPVTVGAGGASISAGDIQNAVVNAVRSRAGTEIMRAARRSGL